MITTEGFNYLLNAGLKQAAQYGAWYVVPFEGNYTPTAADVAATFPTLATESTAYDGATRKEVTFGTVAGGSVDNSAALVEMIFSADETIYGAAVMSTPGKGAAAGVLIAVERFAEPRVIKAGTTLRLLVDLDLIQPTP